MYSEQKGSCQICEKKFKQGVSAHVDHDHDTGEVRGLLCLNCNTGIGKLGDSAVTCLDAAFYLLSVEESKTDLSQLHNRMERLRSLTLATFQTEEGRNRNQLLIFQHSYRTIKGQNQLPLRRQVRRKNLN